MKTLFKNNWEKCLISDNCSIRDAILNIEKSGYRISLVVDHKRVLLGTVTDGDIRRSVLKGINIDSNIKNIMHLDPIVVYKNNNPNDVAQLMNLKKIYQIPVLDENNIIIGLYLFDEIYSPKIINNPIIIMAGGFGTRMRPYTNDCPKPMLLVSGKPLLEHIIIKAKNLGFRNFYITIHYLGHIIKNYFGNGEKWNVHIEYLDEIEPLGTAGSISLISPFPKLPFIIINGDIITNINFIDLLEFHLKYSSDATMSVFKYDLQNPYGVIMTSGFNITNIYEKPVYSSYVNAGIYVLSPNIKSFLTPNERVDMTDLFKRLKESNLKTLAYPLIETWLDVGRPGDLNLATELFTNKKIK